MKHIGNTRTYVVVCYKSNDAYEERKERGKKKKKIEERKEKKKHEKKIATATTENI